MAQNFGVWGVILLPTTALGEKLCERQLRLHTLLLFLVSLTEDEVFVQGAFVLG